MRTILGLAIGVVLSGFVPQEGGDLLKFSVHRTPGKPMDLFDNEKPAEEIGVEIEQVRVALPTGFETKLKYSLVVRVNVLRKGVEKYTEKRADLSEAEGRSLVEIVEREKLMTWKPEYEEGDADDWGSEGYSIQKTSTSLAKEWHRPLKNAAGPDSLSKALAKLAAEKVKDLPLSYIRP